MTALTADRNDIATKEGTIRPRKVAALANIRKGALICMVGGYAAPALNTTGYSNVVGFATEARNNQSGSAGDLTVPVRSGVSINLAWTGGVQAAENNQVIYVADDQTVSTVTNSGVKAGLVEGYVSSTVVRVFIPLGGMA